MYFCFWQSLQSPTIQKNSQPSIYIWEVQICYTDCQLSINIYKPDFMFSRILSLTSKLYLYAVATLKLTAEVLQLHAVIIAWRVADIVVGVILFLMHTELNIGDFKTSGGIVIVVPVLTVRLCDRWGVVFNSGLKSWSAMSSSSDTDNSVWSFSAILIFFYFLCIFWTWFSRSIILLIIDVVLLSWLA